MPHQLDQILISASNPDWHARLREIHTSVRGATYFEDGSEEDSQLNEIIKGVKERKDLALQEYTQRYDGVTLATAQFRVNQQELKKAHDTIDKNLLKLICQSIKNVRKYQEEIFVVNDKSCSNKTGVKYTPIKRVGICVPGAAAPLPSTVIMTVVPAQVAKVKEIAVVSPPRYNNSIHPVILATCFELGIEEVYRIGGAQAVAALAFGTQTITPVSKIIGPGNQWVQMAKRKVFGFVDIDSIAGPSEVLIIANDSANPAWVAADMLSQAEHAPGSAVLFTNSEDFAKRTLEELKKQLDQIGRKEPTIKCLLKFGAIIVFEKTDEVITQANFFAAEHLEIQCGDESRKIARKIENAGAIFIGDYSPVAVGDYWAGPSHTLPTGMTAKFFSPLSANDFIKSTSIIEYDKAKFTQSAEDIIRLAEAEGLDAHAKSIKIRQQN
jgi:histidinol dehydrogenase